MRPLLLLLACAVSTPALAQAQSADEVLIMRRQLAPPNGDIQGPAPTPTPAPTSSPTPAPAPTPTPTAGPAYWVYSPWSDIPADICGDGIITRTATCTNSLGPVDESQCDLAKRENLEEEVSGVTGCKAIWKSDPWSAWSDTCSRTASRTRQVSCVAEQDATIQLDPTSCTAGKPSVTETGLVLSGCAKVDWYQGEWSEWTANCGNAQHTRTVYCEAIPVSAAPFVVDESYCTKEKPATQETALRSNCSNTVENPGFETGSISPWNGTGTAQYNYEGTTNWGTDGDYTGKLLQGQSLTNNVKDLVPGGRYRISFMMRPTATAPTSSLQVRAGNVTQNYARTSSDVSWKLQTIDFNAYEGATPFTFTATQGIFYFDKVTVTPLP